MITPICDMLKKHIAKDPVRFHMPGHKGRSSFLSSEFFKYDITEVGDADNLYIPDGVIKRSQDTYAKFFNAAFMYYLVGGSTAGVIASLLSVGRNKKVIFARDFHLSCVSGMIHGGIRPVFVYQNDRASYSMPVETQSMIDAINENRDASAVYVTYPNYYGRCIDLKKICSVAHSYGIPVIVDCAHGAMFSFSDLLPDDCGTCGADIWVMSLHKTLSAPNQSAVVCVGKNSLISDKTLKKCINLVQTTSPSYPLLACMEHAIAEMAEVGSERIARCIDTVNYLKAHIREMSGFKCIKTDDGTKIYIDVTDRGITGFKASEILEKYGVFVETADQNGLLLMCTHKNNKDDYMRLLSALKMVKGTDYQILKSAFDPGFAKDEIFKLYPRDASLCGSKYVDFTYALDKISAGCAGAYPPGVPVVMPGMKITANVLYKLNKLRECGHTLYGVLDGKIEIVD